MVATIPPPEDMDGNRRSGSSTTGPPQMSMVDQTKAVLKIIEEMGKPVEGIDEQARKETTNVTVDGRRKRRMEDEDGTKEKYKVCRSTAREGAAGNGTGLGESTGHGVDKHGSGNAGIKGEEGNRGAVQAGGNNIGGGAGAVDKGNSGANSASTSDTVVEDMNAGPLDGLATLELLTEILKSLGTDPNPLPGFMGGQIDGQKLKLIKDKLEDAKNHFQGLIIMRMLIYQISRSGNNIEPFKEVLKIIDEESSSQFKVEVDNQVGNLQTNHIEDKENQ